MNESFMFLPFVIGISVGVVLGFFVVSPIYEMRQRKKAWRTLTMGLDDFDIKCINEEYAKRKHIEQEGKA